MILNAMSAAAPAAVAAAPAAVSLGRAAAEAAIQTAATLAVLTGALVLFGLVSKPSISVTAKTAEEPNT